MKIEKVKRFALKLVLITLFVCLLTGVFCSFGISVSASDPEQKYNIYSADELVAYAQAYAAGDRNPNDVLSISITSGSTILDSRFISLGTSGRPFSGTLIIPTAGIDTFILANCPLFDYVTTDLKIVDANGDNATMKMMREAADETPADGVLTTGALFANHVVGGTGAANWSISLLPYSGDNVAASSFEGLIGDIAAGATVNVSFTNTANVGVSGSGDLGLICGTLGAGATLNVSTAGSGSNLSVSSTGGNAGSLVGKMNDGSTLKFNSTNHSRVTSVTSATDYAGGIVGYANNITVEYAAGVSDYAVSGTVTGKSGAGGLFGYYKNTTSPVTFGLEKYSLASGMTISATSYAGGIFGYLENTGASFTFNGNASGSEVYTVLLSGGTGRGGICGCYKTSALSNTFTITNTEPTVRSVTSNSTTGGLIGTITAQPAYISISDVSVHVGSGTLYGGLIGSLGSGGSFADLSGSIAVSGNTDAGLIGSMPHGVLRIQGTTDLSAANISGAYFVKNRDRALVYALGDGMGLTGTHGNWKILRKINNQVDDIGSWGQVIRADGTILSEGDLFTVDGSAHTVTVKAPVTAMATVTDFAKTALNIKLNTGAGVGALQFASATRSATLLSGSLSLSGDIDLSGTGLLGFARDDGGNNAFSGSFDGNGHSISLAIGEQYGLKLVSTVETALAATDRQGNIYTHRYNGLFAETAGATIEDLTVTGTSIIFQNAGVLTKEDSPMRMGGIVAYATGSLTLTRNTVDLNQNYKSGGDFALCFGGAVGEADKSDLSITVTNGSYLPEFHDVTASTTAAGTQYAYVGGVIGFVDGFARQVINMDGCTVGLVYDKPDNAHRASCFGGAIAKIANVSYVKANRRVTLTGVATDVTVTNGRTDSANAKFGGILGTEWLGADVTINGLDLTASIQSAATTAVGYGGLVQIATGGWDVQSLTVDSVNFNLPSNGSSFGFIANKTYTTEDSKNNALYLEVDNTSGNYDIAAMTFTGTPTLAAFDEIVASSRFNDTALASNGNSVISIKTSGDLINTTSGDPNTYLNQTAFGKTAAGATNSNTRYYYNLAYARSHTATSKYNFLVWTVKQYAHSSLSAWFTATNTFTGDLDMTGLSYYPIDLTTGVTFSNVSSLKLDNIKMDEWVKTAYTSNTTRGTRASTSQHYLMHTAIFRNVTANITVSTGMTMQGNVPKLSDSFCGFLVAGTLGGSDTASIRFTAANLALDGVYISNGDNHFTTNAYAPLLINKIGKNTTLTVNGAAQSTSGYSSYAGNSWYAGSSLIGDVGDTTASAIYLTFKDLKLDGRSTAVDPGNLDSCYGTTKSIFSRASILNSFRYVRESSGKYDFTITDDWGTGTAVHNVTYGKEITSSVENADLQKKYSESTYYTHRSTYQSGSPDDFSTGFLPYVYEAYNLGEYKHELAVNITVDQTIKGCGKYNDPFEIDEDGKLEIVSAIISNNTGTAGAKIQLPSDLTSYDYTGTSYTKHTYTFGAENFTSSDVGASNKSNPNVRRYLAGAYYKITKDITLRSNYVSLGSTTDANREYAFRGVIIGAGNPTITNTSVSPLIHSSYGCVIQGLTVDVAVDITGATPHTISLSAPTGTGLYNFSGGNDTYGALIGRVFGGDTFIDRVQVTFNTDVGTATQFNITASDSSHYTRLVPIGGYIGVLVNGGVIFRNMTASNVGLTATTTSLVTDSGYLYVNPIIGRVIAGYAFHETADTYHATEATTTLKNGTKNYSISDLSLAEAKLDVKSSNQIVIPNGQAMYILGAILNSGAGAATSETGDYSDYNSSADNFAFWQAYRGYTATRAGSSYSTVGSASGTDYTKACLDSHSSGLTKIPYIISAYTVAYDADSDGETDDYYARRIAEVTTTMKVTGNCDVAAGFRGLGGIYEKKCSHVQITVQSMTGKIGSTQNSYTITLHMDFKEYNHKLVSVYIANAEETDANKSQNTAGFGLFNRLNMTSSSSSNSIQYLTLSGSVFYDVYKLADGTPANYNFALYKDSHAYDRTETGYGITSGDTEDVTQRKTLLAVGGLAGYVGEKAYIKNVTFNDLSVEGAKSAGGLIGFVHLGNTANVLQIVYESGITNAGYVNVVGGLQAGGLIGRIYRSQVDILGAVGGTDIIIKNVESKNSDPNETGMYYFANINTGVGGIVGTCWATDKLNNGITNSADTTASFTLQKGSTIASRKLFITNINVVKGDSAANVRVLNNSDNKTNYAGGFLGSAHNTYIKLENCRLQGVNVSANAAGGFIGRMTQKYYLEIIGCSANGNGKTASVSGSRFAGGAVGWVVGRDTLYFQLLNFITEEYLIESTSTGEVEAGAGGAVGYAEGNNKALSDSNNYICEFNNLTVLNCTIKTNYSDSTSNNLKYKNGTGGIMGVIDTINVGTGAVLNELTGGRTTTYKYKFSGYNILVKDCTLIHLKGGDPAKNYSIATGANKNRRIGDLVGSNAVESPLKFVGVSVQNSGYYIDAETNGYCGKHVGYYNDDNDHYGTDPTTSTATYTKYGNGYVVFANFNAATGGTTHSNVYDEDHDTFVNVDAAYPYVTVNPTLTIGGQSLTGDGIATSLNDLAIKNILLEGTDGTYRYAASAYYSGSSGDTNYAAFNAYVGKLAMFTSEVPSYLGTNFPVLILDDTNHANSHKMINSYLRMLTNTVHDFGGDVTNVYSVVIYNMAYADGAFTPTTTGASLKRLDGQFYMSNNSFDSGKMQFSLIDVRFYDPANPSKVAYHLYVPVFVKKVLSYQFDIAVLSGTDYWKNSYLSQFGSALIENVGTPVTFFFRYTYSKTNAEAASELNVRTTAEWQSAINAGENVIRYYAKKLQFYKANTNDVLKDFPAETILVLVDPNRGGVPYYATIETALSGNQLNLGAFRRVMTKVGDTVTFSGDYFEPLDLEQLMQLSYTQLGGGADYMVTCDAASATVMVGSQGYRLATDEEYGNAGIEKYTIVVGDAPMIEEYYLSVFTESNAINDELFHYYLIQSPTAFEEVSYPSRITDTGAHSLVHLVMGKIFHHDDFAISSTSEGGVLLMSEDNKVLTITMSAEMGISEDLPTQIRENMKTMIEDTDVYQGFLVYLNREEDPDSYKAILGNPTAAGSYAIGDGSPTAYAGGDIQVTQNLARFRTGDLSAQFASGDLFTIEAVVSLTYSPAAIQTQFPSKTSTAPDNGVWISGSSNIAFSPDAVTNSKNMLPGEETPHLLYYSEAEPDVASLDLNPISDRVGDFTPLGINALNNGGLNFATFDLLAVLDVTSISDLVSEYASATVTVTLLQKQNDGSYTAINDISEYLSVELIGLLPSAVIDGGASYSANIARSNPYLSDTGAEITVPVLRFTVKTSAALEDDNQIYGNYRVNVAVELKDSGGTAYPSSHAENFVVYSNVKVIPSFIGN